MNDLLWEDHGQSQSRPGGTTQEVSQERTSPSPSQQDVLLRPEQKHLGQVCKRQQTKKHKIGTNRPRSAGQYLCLDEEVPVDKKIPHSLNPGGCHRGDLLEPCNRRHKIVGAGPGGHHHNQQ